MGRCESWKLIPKLFSYISTQSGSNTKKVMSVRGVYDGVPMAFLPLSAALRGGLLVTPRARECWLWCLSSVKHIPCCLIFYFLRQLPSVYVYHTMFVHIGVLSLGHLLKITLRAHSIFLYYCSRGTNR